MNDENQLLDRETWCTEAAQYILDDLIRPEMHDQWQPAHPFRVSMGYAPRTTARSKTIAVCIVAEASADGHNELFISPSLDDSAAILEALAHEMIHYADNCASGHRNHFARVARAIGLEGPLTATVAGADLARKLADIGEMLGPIPHAKIDLGKAKAKQGTRMIKVTCPDNDCGFHYRTSQTNINKVTDFLCPACNVEEMQPES